MADIIEIRSDNPQPRLIKQVANLLNDKAVVAIPTNSSYALVTRGDNIKGIDRIRRIRKLDPNHDFTLLFADLKQLGVYAKLTTTQFRAIKANSRDLFTFILAATKEVQKHLLTKRRTIGCRLPSHPIIRDILSELSEPLASVTLIPPGEKEVLTNADDIDQKMGHDIDLIIRTNVEYPVATTVIQWLDICPVLLRRGAGDPALFDLRE